MRFRSLALTVGAYAVAMAYLESAVVVYLQRAIAIDPDRLFPLSGPEIAGNLAVIEVGREFATLVMLATVGCLAGRRWIDRLAWTAVAFGLWDIFYYVWLWVFIGWPHGPATWDVLFLIPAPAYLVRLGRVPAIGRTRAAGAIAGGLLVVISFAANAPTLLAGGSPGWFPWPVFAAGMALSGWAAASWLRTSQRQGGD